MQSFIALVCIVILSTMFAIASVIAGLVLSPKAPSKLKNDTYECGMKIFEDSRIQYNLKFFIFAVMFLIFEVASILLFPFAVIFSKLGLYTFVEVAFFMSLLLFGLCYASKNKLLEWK